MRILENTISLMGLELIAKGVSMSSTIAFNHTLEDLIGEIAYQEWLGDMTANCEEYLPYEEPSEFVPLDEEDFDEIGF